MRLEAVMLGVLDGLLSGFELPDMPNLPDPPDLSALLPELSMPDLSLPEVPALPSVDVDLGGLVPSALDPLLSHPWLTLGAVALLAVAVRYRERTVPAAGRAARRSVETVRTYPMLLWYAGLFVGGFVLGRMVLPGVLESVQAALPAVPVPATVEVVG